MTRKDYELIARAFTLARPIAPPNTSSLRAAHYTLDDMARHLADGLASDNPRFDRARFLAACGVEVGDPLADVRDHIARNPDAFDPV